MRRSRRSCTSSRGRSTSSRRLPPLRTLRHQAKGAIAPSAAPERAATCRLLRHDVILGLSRAMAAQGAGAPGLPGEAPGISHAPLHVVTRRHASRCRARLRQRCASTTTAGSLPPIEGMMGRHRSGRPREAMLHADAARLLAEADYPPSVKQTILLALRGGRPGKQICLACGKAGAALPVLAAASAVTGGARPAGAPRGLLALCDASWPAHRRRDRGLARTPWPGRHGRALSEDVSQTCTAADAVDTAQHGGGHVWRVLATDNTAVARMFTA